MDQRLYSRQGPRTPETSQPAPVTIEKVSRLEGRNNDVDLVRDPSPGAGQPSLAFLVAVSLSLATRGTWSFLH